ncbi:efflux RND transporter permease subunit [Serratia ureilytica]
MGALLALRTVRRAVQPDRADRHHAVDRHLVKKNAIMMVDFALEAQRNGGISAREAIFRPACCVSARHDDHAGGIVRRAAAGADQRRRRELRQPLGITIAGGTVMSQLLTLYTTPVVYLYFDRLQAKFRRNKQLAPLPR